MKPFANESDATEIGELKVENRTDRLSLYGSLDITRDEAGLALVRKLKALIDDTEATLLAERSKGALPKRITIEEPVIVPNPLMPR